MDDRTLISFKNVSFSYHDAKNALNDINLDITLGEKVAIIAE
jgi:ABC-type transport system involved in cytochrome bd biosynthesis fused ATPase/permease subunit